MQEAGVTFVSVGIFSWARIQPSEGVFDFGWLDRILDLLHEGGIRVNLATASASPPPWVTKNYPEILPQTADGITLGPGSRQHYAPSSPVFRRLVADLVGAIAARYAQHPAVEMWHVNNEYGAHVHYDYSNNARDAFCRWLTDRYGDIATLNAAWGTAFWSQIYTDFDEILPPRTAPMAVNPAHALDFKRFTSDAMLDLYILERDTIRATGATQPVTTNFMGAFPPLDYWRWAQEVDVITDDCYPDPNDPEAFRLAAFTRDLMRSLKPGVPWLLMEQSTGALNWRPTNPPKAPGQMAALSAQAIGHGADGIMFFQWRQSRRGSEKFHSAMLPHTGTESEIWQDVTALGDTLVRLPKLAPDSGARVALVFDWENWWALAHPDHPLVFDYLRVIQRWYSALHAQHVSIDIVQPSGDLGGYALVIAPEIYLLTDAGAANLTAFTAAGGHLFVSAFSDVVDHDDAFREGGFLVGLRDVLGVTVDEFGALVQPEVPPGPSSAGSPGFTEPASNGPGERHATVSGPFGSVRGEYFAEQLRVLDADVIGTFADGRRAGRPALTRRSHGAGMGIYLGTIPNDEGMRTVLRWLLGEAGVSVEIPDLSPWIEVAQRGDVLTIINHGEESQRIAVVGTDVSTHLPVDSIELPAFGWRMIRVRLVDERSRAHNCGAVDLDT